MQLLIYFAQVSHSNHILIQKSSMSVRMAQQVIISWDYCNSAVP